MALQYVQTVKVVILAVMITYLVLPMLLQIPVLYVNLITEKVLYTVLRDMIHLVLLITVPIPVHQEILVLLA